MLNILKSTQDSSVNFVDKQNRGFLESRFVRRGSEYFICYLSSQTGCNRGCQFCHLTSTKQTVYEDATPDQILSQAHEVLSYYSSLKDPAKYVHFNFMARGEPLASKHLISNGDDILSGLGGVAKLHGLPSKVNISTIMPLTFRGSLVDVFGYTQPTIYYSFYSIDEDFRKKWLPGAMPYGSALDILKEYQVFTGGKQVKIHFALIDGENDHLDDIEQIVNVVSVKKLNVSFNIVRYNPPDSSSRESSEQRIREVAEKLNNHFPTQIVSRVGYDVKASCGMFIK